MSADRFDIPKRFSPPHNAYPYNIYTSQPECVNTILHCAAIWGYTSTCSWIYITYIIFSIVLISDNNNMRILNIRYSHD